jgi:hypothetical protein
MTSPPRHRLGVDLGTSTTIAMMQWPDGRVRPLLFDGSPLLSSAVLLGVDGQLHTGRDAAHLGRGTPERLEPNPKRRIDDDMVLLGNAEVPVRELLAAVLGRVSLEARRVAGHLGDLTLTHPAAWGPRRCAQLLEAAERAGLGRGRLVPEPVAAATYFAHTMLDRFPPGSRVVVYDLGAGTCDITVLRRGPHGFDIVASDGLNDVGGLDVDAAIVGFLEATYGRLWTDAVSRRQVWEDVRNAKEMLSRTSGTVIALPALGKEAPLGREQFDGLIGPVLRPTIALAKSLILDTSGAAVPGAPTAVVLVGGASRIPLVATLLAEATGVPPIVIEQPELVVAEGALHLGPAAVPGGAATGPAWAGRAAAGTGQAPGFAGPSAPVSGPGGPAMPVSGGGPAMPVSAPGGPAMPVSGPGGPAMPVSGPGGPAAPVSGVSGPAGPVSGGFGAVSGQWGSGEFTPAPGLAASGTMPSGVGFAPGGLAPGGPGLAPGGGRAPARRPGGRGGLAIVAAVAVAVLLLAGAAGTGVWLLNRDDPGKKTGNNSPTTGSGQTGGGATTGENAGGPTAAKYQMSVLPENLCSKVDIGKFASSYEKELSAPYSVRNVNSFVSTAICSISRQRGNDTLSLTLTMYVYADTNQAVTAQRQALDTAKVTDPNTIVLTGIGEEAHVAQTGNQSSSTVESVTYTVEARDGNLRMSLLGISTRIQGRSWTDQDRRQFANDLGDVVKTTIAKLGSG